MATGIEMFGHRVWNGPYRVWLWNLEDEMEEVEKTIHAFLKLWDISPESLADRLFIDGVDSLGSRLLKIGVADRSGGHVIRRPVVDALVDEMKDRGIDHLAVDRSEEHTSELKSLMRTSSTVFCLKKKKNQNTLNKNNEEYN